VEKEAPMSGKKKLDFDELEQAGEAIAEEVETHKLRSMIMLLLVVAVATFGIRFLVGLRES
jgi:hypothetical protein